MVTVNEIITCNVVHNLSVSSACNVEKLVDIGADGVTFLCAHTEAPLQVGGVIIDHCLDLLQDHVEPEVEYKYVYLSVNVKAANNRED